MKGDVAAGVDLTLPGGDLVRAGIVDLERGIESPAAMMVAEASPRLRELGLDVPNRGIDSPSHQLFRLLVESHGPGAYSRYNAYFRRMVSFCRAAVSTGSGLAVKTEPGSGGPGGIGAGRADAGDARLS